MPCILLLHSYIPSQFNSRFSHFLLSSNFSLCSTFLCSRLTQNFSQHGISEVVRGSFFLNLRQLFINFVIQADTLNILCNSYLSSKKSNKSFCLTVVAIIFFTILASFSDSLGQFKIG